MFNKSISIIIMSLFICSCDSNSENEPIIINDEIVPQTITENVKVDSSLTEDIKLFEMHPESIISELRDDEDFQLPDIMYYSGKIGNNTISMILYDNKGAYIYHKSGKAFSIFYHNLKDTIIITRTKEGSTEKFIGIQNHDSNDFTGIWHKDGDTLSFSLKEEINTPEKIQLFINLSVENLKNTSHGLVVSEPYNSINFNTFYITTNIGEGYDNGQEWIINDEQLYLYDSTLVFVNCELINNESNSGNGTEYSMYGRLKYKVITSGLILEKKLEIDLNKTTTFKTWLFKDYIVLTSDRDESSITYKFDKELETYNLINE